MMDIPNLPQGEGYSNLILENFPAAVIIITAQGTIEVINPHAEQMFGYDFAELNNLPINTLVPLDFREQHQIYLDSSKMSASRVLGATREILGLKKNGETFPVKIELSDFMVGGEKKFIGVIFDILRWSELNTYAPSSQYVLSEVSRQLLESEAKYKTLFDKSDDPMWLIIDGRFEVCNESSVKILGYSDKEELKHTHPSALSPEFQADGRPSYEKADEMMSLAIKNGYHRFDWLHMRKNGEIFPVEVSLTRVLTDNKESLFCVWRDISGRKRAEEEIVRARDEAQSASKAKSDFLALMSHELRTPLNAILGYSELLALKIAGPLNEKQDSILKDIHIGADILFSLVTDLLHMTDIERGTLEVTLENHKVSYLLEHAVPLVAPLAEKKNVTVHVNQACGVDAAIVVDEVRMEQILMNLLSNAIKYNRIGSNVWLSAHEKSHGIIRLSVKDDGEGINPKYKETVFDLFTRAGKESSGVEGTGIGLNIVKSLVRAMNGQCGYDDNDDNNGVTFWVDMPIAS